MPENLNILALAPPKERVALEQLTQLICHAGGKAMLVGGCVRDALFGEQPQDFDVEVYGLKLDALLKVLESKFKLNLVGSSFGVVKLNDLQIDISLPRTENKVGYGHRGFVVESDINLSYFEAAARRDFTVNAIMYDLQNHELIDPHNGVADLQKKLLRPVSKSFGEDPLRVLRAMQFLARFQFEASCELITACQVMTPEGLAIERQGDEWRKLLLKGEKISLGLEFLKQTGWLQYYPELAVLVDCPQHPPWHPEGDVWQHTLHCVDAAVKLRSGNKDDDLVMMLGVLCHDLGKPATTQFEADGRITSKNHEPQGIEPSEKFVRSLFRERELPRQVSELVEHHLKPYTFFYHHASDRAFRRLLTKVSRIDLLLKVAEADSAGRPPLPTDFPPLTWFKERLDELELASGAPQPLVLGRHVLAQGVKPGIGVGKLTAACFEAQLDGEFNTLADGIKYLQKIIEQGENK